MKLTWLGHACFELAGDCATVLTDPYDAAVGYPFHPRKADAVTVSHAHHDHSDLSWIEAGAVFRDPGIYECHGAGIHGIPSFHDEHDGRERGSNVIFKITMDGLSVVHLGDLGHPLGEDKIRTIGLVDILLVPVGGTYTIDARQALQIVRQLGARLVIPMHYKTGAVQMPIANEQSFLSAMNGRKSEQATIDVDRHSLPAATLCVALGYLL